MTNSLQLYHEANRYTTIFAADGLYGKRDHIQNVIKLSSAIAVAQKAAVDLEKLAILAEHHDDGRVDQFRLLGKFWDNEVAHNELGADRLDKFILQNGLNMDDDLALMRDVMLYHGRQKLAYGLSEDTMSYINVISAGDDFENATACVSYLIHEVETDAKGYNANVNLDQKCLTPEYAVAIKTAFYHGQKFNKTVCKTYADYIMFAATLATQTIRQYGELGKVAFKQPGYGYESILEGFKDVFEKCLNPDLAAWAYVMMREMLK